MFDPHQVRANYHARPLGFRRDARLPFRALRLLLGLYLLFQIIAVARKCLRGLLHFGDVLSVEEMEAAPRPRELPLL